MRRLIRNLSLGLAASIWSLAFGSAAWATGSVRLEYVKANNVLSAETVSSSGASVQSSAAPDFGGVTGQVRVNGLSGAVIVTVAATNPVATQTNGYRIQSCSQALMLPITTGQKVAIIEATDANSCAAGGGGGGAVTAAASSYAAGALVDGADTTEGLKADAACAAYSSACTLNSRLAAIEKAAEDVSTESPVKIADGSNVAEGSKALSACATDNGTCSLIELIKRLNQRLTTLDTDLGTLHSDNATAIVAGSNLIGKVGTDQTTHGTSDLVAADITKVAGTAIVNGGLAGSFSVGGTAAANAAPTENPLLQGCEFKTNTTAATTGQKQFSGCDAFGNQGKSFTPAMATQITAQSATTANTANTATLAGVASKFTYISGFACTSGGATAAQLATVTVAGTITGSMTYTIGIPAGVAAAATPLIVTFPNPVQASAVNTAITVQIGAAGSGNTAEQCNAQGFQQ